jgi:outer membrane receptor protein involved in Fe transport
MKKMFYILIMVQFIFAGQLLAGITGKIAGVVKDGESGMPLPGVNVIIEGTSMGAATELRGEYVILNIPPGVYDIKASMMGYTPQRYTGVRVSIDLTTTIDFELKTTVLDIGEEVTIVAERPLIRKDITSSRSIVSTEEIKEMPVENMYQVLELQAGVVRGSGGEMHIRGGRSGEVAYLVDGISVTDPYSSSMAITVENNAIQELEMVSGTFNAEYGQAMSAVVNIVTKEGSDSYNGMIESYIGDYFSNNKDIFFNIDHIDPLAIKNLEGTFSGPVPFLGNKLTFFTSGRYYDSDGYFTGIRRYDAADSNNYSDTDPSKWIIQETGDGEFVQMSTSKSFSTNLKLSYRLNPTIKLIYSGTYSNSQAKYYSHSYKLNPDGRPTSRNYAYDQMLTWTHSLSPSTFYTVKLLNFHNNGRSYVFDDPYDERYVSPRRFDAVAAYQFIMGGMNMGHFYRSTTSNVLKTEIVSQVNKTHQIKSGAEYRWNRLFLNSYSIQLDLQTNWEPRIPDVTELSHDQYVNYPWDFSCYIQDKIELKDMIVNLGLRFEYFDPNGLVLTDYRDPDIWRPYKNRIVNAIANGDTVQIKLPVRINPETNEVTYIDPNTGKPIGSQVSNIRARDATDETVLHNLSEVLLVDPQTGTPITRGTMGWFQDTNPTYQLSPRIGIAYPITDRGVIHISYGHFLKIPNYSYLYVNPEFEYPEGGEVLMGNADLKPEQTVSYEIGLQQQLTEDLAFDVTGFYKDVRNWLGTKIYQHYEGTKYAIYFNRDYGNVRGITFSLTKRYSHFIAASLDYTFSVAEGNASNPNSAFYDLQNNREPEKQIVYLDWDQTHTLNGSITISRPRDWSISLVGQYGSGLPYTAESQGLYGFQQLGTTFENNARKPAMLNVDLKMRKDVYYKNINFSLFLKIYNLFDRLNEENVFGDTGRATYTLTALRVPDSPGPNTVEDYLVYPQYYSAPRSIRFGVSVNF